MPGEPFPFEEGVRRVRVRQLFLARYARHHNKPTANDVLLFFAWLQGHYPHLLPKGRQGDPYRHLKVDLKGLYD